MTTTTTANGGPADHEVTPAETAPEQSAPAADPQESAAAETVAAEQTEGQQSEDGDDKGPGKASRDAARYRTQLRAVEAERDGLVERVAGLQRAAVEALAGATITVPADLWDVGRVELAALLDEHGDVDPAAVQVAVSDLMRTRPRLGREEDVWNRRRAAPGGPLGKGESNESTSVGWGRVLSGGRHD